MAINEEDIRRLVGRITARRLTVETDPVFKRKVREWAQAALDDLGVDVTFEMINSAVPEFLRHLSAVRIKGANERTKRKIRKVLTEGVEAGEGIEKLAKRVQKAFKEISRGRARMIARTETNHAAGWSTLEAFNQAEIPGLKKQWLSTMDKRTRAAHRGLMGQVRNLKEKFKILSGKYKGSTAMHPCAFGNPALDVACRCGITAAHGGKALPASHVYALWKKHDRNLIPWETQVLAALRRGLSKQEHDVVQGIRALA